MPECGDLENIYTMCVCYLCGLHVWSTILIGISTVACHVVSHITIAVVPGNARTTTRTGL
jgi:hypothetical protein